MSRFDRLWTICFLKFFLQFSALYGCFHYLVGPAMVARGQNCKLWFLFFFQIFSWMICFYLLSNKIVRNSCGRMFIGTTLFSYHFDFSSAHFWFEFLFLDFWINVVIQTFKQLNWSSILLDVLPKIVTKLVSFCHFWMLLFVLITSNNTIWSLCR